MCWVSYTELCHVYISDAAVEVLPIKASSLEEAIQEVENTLKTTFTKQILLTERELSACQEDCPTVRRQKQFFGLKRIVRHKMHSCGIE